MAVVGGLLSMLMRLQLAFPNTVMPFMAKIMPDANAHKTRPSTSSGRTVKSGAKSKQTA